MTLEYWTLYHSLHLQCQDALKYENNRFITVFEGLFYCNNRGGNSGKRFEEWEIPQPMEMYDKQALKKKGAAIQAASQQ